MPKKPDIFPQKGDKAFVYVNDSKFFHSRSISRHHPPHAEAFKSGAEMVIDSVLASSRNYDEMLLPVCYLYRHCLELKLKQIIGVGRYSHFFSKDEWDAVRKLHNLMKLWNSAKRFLVDRFSSEDPAPMQATEAILNEFHKADPSGQAFRYARSDCRTDQQDFMPEHVDVAHLRSIMDRVHSFLDACYGILTAQESERG